jgi:hypothetical protein
MKQNVITLSFAAFAHDIGAHTRITLDASKVWHLEYQTADKTTRTARREEFILNFLLGYGVPEAKVTKVMAQSRTERGAADQKVYDAARAKFTYHVIRPDATTKPEGATAKAGKAEKAGDLLVIALEAFAALSAAQKKAFMAVAK